MLSAAYRASAAARLNGDLRLSAVFQLFRVGLRLSAFSCALRLFWTPQPGLIRSVTLAACLAGTAFLWLGCLEYGRLQRERGRADLPPAAPYEEEGLEADGLEDYGFRLSASARLALRHAQDETRRRGQYCLDTDGLLLGLLREPHNAACQVLGRLGVGTERLCLDLLAHTAASRLARAEAGAAMPTLSDRACQVFALAAQEAHRFGKEAVGTEHLLLGLVLVGRGPAAAILFGEGVTVERVRDEVLRAARPAAQGRP